MRHRPKLKTFFAIASIALLGAAGCKQSAESEGRSGGSETLSAENEAQSAGSEMPSTESKAQFPRSETLSAENEGQFAEDERNQADANGKIILAEYMIKDNYIVESTHVDSLDRVTVTIKAPNHSTSVEIPRTPTKRTGTSILVSERTLGREETGRVYCFTAASNPNAYCVFSYSDHVSPNIKVTVFGSDKETKTDYYIPRMRRGM